MELDFANSVPQNFIVRAWLFSLRDPSVHRPRENQHLEGTAER